MDEGGYAYVARQWSRGASLYSSDWIDRPQGLLVTYRFLLWLAPSGISIRVAALVLGALMTVLLGLIGCLLFGSRAGVYAAALYSVAGLVPRLEGFTLNGELLATVPATAAVAAVLYSREKSSLRGIVFAGILAGIGICMKQSGFDGIVVGVVIIALTPRLRLQRLVSFISGVGIPVSSCVFHGVVVGWSVYWNALIGYQLSSVGSDNGLHSRLAAFTRHLGPVALDLGPLALLAILGLYAKWRSPLERISLLAWLMATAVGVNLGGSYWVHYYVQLVPPLVLLGAAFLSTLDSRLLRGLLLSVTTASVFMWLVFVMLASPLQRQRTIPYYGRTLRDQGIAKVIQAQTHPRDQIYVLLSEANLYFLANRTTGYPYLWGKPIEKIAGALGEISSMLQSENRPIIVVLNSDPAKVDPSGKIAVALRQHYHLDRFVNGVEILRAD